MAELEFSTPEEAEECRLERLEEIQDIERQLAERKADVESRAADYPEGYIPRAEYAEYLTWRKSAIAARFHLTNQMRDAKEAKRELAKLARVRLMTAARGEQVRSDDGQFVAFQLPYGPDEGATLRSCCDLLRRCASRMAAYGILPFTPEEQAFMDRLRAEYQPQ